ncbi:hypothetical protein MMC29_005545 [Sticta canariensis]|nr:hypothetical protein [Sticta canariensis]
MCKFYYVPCQTYHCSEYVRGYMKPCVRGANCPPDCIPQPSPSGAKWCLKCDGDGTRGAWLDLEMQIRTQGVYQRWIAILSGKRPNYGYDAAGALTIVPPLPLFTQLRKLGMQPPALGFHDVQRGSTFYSLPFGLREQDLTAEEKAGVPVLFTPAEFNFETMRRHWIGLSRFHWRLEGFLIEIGLGKLPWSEKMDW